MLARGLPYRRTAPFRPQLAGATGAVLCAIATVVAAGLVLLMGLYALLIPFYGALLAGVIFAPRKAVFVLLGLGVVFEPGAIDYTQPVGDALFAMPPALGGVPFTTSPMELLLLITAISLYFRPSARERKLPVVIWLIPVTLGLGFMYGMYRGGVSTIAYNEARGLIYGCVTFLIVIRLGIKNSAAIRPTLLWAGLGLAVIVIVRYLFFVRGTGIPSEIAFAHEDAAFLGIAFVAGCGFLIRAESHGERLRLAAFCLIVLAAEMASARRAGILVIFVGAAVMAWLVLPKRPLLVLSVMIPVLAIGSVYLAAYWNKQYGAVAQPARAIRSQIAPSERDQDSDVYRATEKYDVEQTLHGNPLFGVGFGRSFAPYRPLPSLLSFWPLQWYTPHTNVLWLWLKMGILGITAALSVWVVALKRCLVALRDRPRDEPVPLLPLLLACSLLMYLAYARVDLALVGARSMAPFAAVIALALCLPASKRWERGGKRE